jgi:hypothetical protein
MDVSNDVIRVIDLTDNALVASASRAEVTASPAQHGGGPVLVGWHPRHAATEH